MFDQWNNVHGMWNLFSYTSGSVPCNGDINHSNGRNQIYFGLDGEMDGALGVTYIRYSSSCFWWNSEQDIIEADIAINSSVTWQLGSPVCTDHRTNRDLNSLQYTALHEMGHSVGLGHEKGPSAIMAPTSGGGLHYCYSESIQPNPDDATGGRYLESSGNSARNLAASSFKSAGWGTGLVDPNDPDITRDLCPGDHFDTDWSVSNNGTVGLTYDVQWYLSPNNYISTFDHASSGNSGAHQPAGTNGFWTEDAFVPNTVTPYNTYFIGTYLDQNNQINERIESDNRTYSDMKIKIGNCP